MLPLFKTHYSIGKSILTLDDPKKACAEGSDSVFSIAKENNLKQLILVEDSFTGFFEAHKRCKELNINLIFGLRLSMRNSALPEDESSKHKVVIFAKDSEGCKLMSKIYSQAFCEFTGFSDYASLKKIWNNDHLKMAIPFYDSFIYCNNFSFCNAIPDLSFTKPDVFIESNGLALDFLLEHKASEFAKTNSFDTCAVKSIYYKSKKDVKAFMTYKIICNRTFGKERSLERPELSHFCSDRFSFEAWKQESNTNS